MKGSKMKRRSPNVSLSPTGKTGKKGVIMEMEEEYSVSGESGDIKDIHLR